MQAELTFLRRVQQFDALGGRELVGRDVIRHVRGVVAALQVRAVAADASDDRHAVGVGAERDRVHVPRIDVADVGHHGLQPASLAVGRLAEVEARQPGLGVGLAAGDQVEVVFHARRERVVHEVGEVPLEQRHDRERRETRHERRALLAHIPAILHGRDRRRVGRRPAHAELLEPLHQRSLGEARRRLRLVPAGLQIVDRQAIALGHVRQHALLVLQLGVGVVRPLHVRTEEPGEQDRLAARSEHGVAAVSGGHPEADRYRLTAGVGHLRRDGALPDQLVEPELLGSERLANLLGTAEPFACRADGLMRLLCVLHLLGVGTRLIGQVGGAVALRDQRASCGDGRVRQRRRVGSHVRDEPVLVQTLRERHGLRRREPELASGLLLQRRGHERWIRPTRVRLAFDAAHRDRSIDQRVSQHHAGGLVEQHDTVAGDLTGRVEVATGDDLAAVDLQQRCAERGLVGLGRGVTEPALEVPVRAGHEAHPLALPLDDDADRHRLHATGRQAAHDLLPEHRADLVAVQPVEDAPRLLGVDKATVEIARVLDRMADRLWRDLVEDHPPDGHLRVQHLQEVPRNRLALAILIGREIELVGLLQQRLQVADLVLLVGGDDVQRLEVVVDVDAEVGPLLLLVRLGDLRRLRRQVANVTDRRLDHVLVAEKSRDRARLCRRLHNDQGGTHRLDTTEGCPRGCQTPALKPRAPNGRARPSGDTVTASTRDP